MSYVYICSQRGNMHNEWTALYTVGFYDPNGEWVPESDWSEKEIAASRVHFLNGGAPREVWPR